MIKSSLKYRTRPHIFSRIKVLEVEEVTSDNNVLIIDQNRRTDLRYLQYTHLLKDMVTYLELYKK